MDVVGGRRVVDLRQPYRAPSLACEDCCACAVLQIFPLPDALRDALAAPRILRYAAPAAARPGAAAWAGAEQAQVRGLLLTARLRRSSVGTTWQGASRGTRRSRNFPHHVAAKVEGRHQRGPVHRRLICCVLAIEIAEHERRELFDQIRLTEDLRRVLADAAGALPKQELIAIAREDGALLAFVADAVACFAAALALRQACLTDARHRDLQPRIGIDLGPVEVLEDDPGQAYLGGEGRRDAERLMRQGPPCQLSVSRSFFELLSRAAPDLAAQLKYQGLLTDTAGRPLGWYALDATLAQRPPQGGEPDFAARAEPGVAVESPGWCGRVLGGKRRLPLRYALLPLFALAAALAPLGELHAPSPALPPVDPDGMFALRAVESSLSEPVTAADPWVKAAPGGAHARTPAPTRKSAAPPHPRPVPAPAYAAAAGPPAAAAQANRIPPVPPKAEAGVASPPAVASSAKPVPGQRPGVRSSAPVSVRLAVRPWGEVSVDGRKVGVTPPLKMLQLRPGKHLIVITNGTLPAYRKELVVHAEPAAVTLTHDFSCASVRDLPCPEAIGTPLLASSHYRPKTTGDRASGRYFIIGRAGRADPAVAPATAARPASGAEGTVAAR
jgi:hypothetical protein